ncbi:lysophospholipase L1-like esterase [Melghirimyces profundicolus]|uniref:Lysophospholipase L1-like esterase n=1 Tax=Melghirimyces profundicolus TaxID=1242148 RepID=A0A2T6C8W0_9BACL|nr:SGNH/GDSL hydrolase family protein [Melghirimyces profundicolus]PTX64716.1 lysophospholipase L1-like esterase [Melghirimyces profundicolus]
MRSPRTFVYTALGDSITRGYSAPGKRGYVDMLASELGWKLPSFRAYNAGIKGLTSRQLLLRLQYSLHLRLWVRRANLLTLWVGGNDLLYAYLRNAVWNDPRIFNRTLSDYQTNINGILSRIQSLQAVPPLVCNLYNPIPHSKLALQWIPVFNHALQEICDRRDLSLVDIHAAFQGREPELIHGYRNGRLSDMRLLKKPIHPNLRGHRVITETLLEVIHG